jgi:DNA-binding NarL/FixJ family response regulator
MDLSMPGMSGAEATSAILEAEIDAAVCILTMSEQDADLFHAIRAGARGYLLKDSSVTSVHRAITTLADGGTVISPGLATHLLDEFARMTPPPKAEIPLSALTVREREVLQYIAVGWKNQEIADDLEIAVNTVKVHLRNILEKLDLRNRQHVAAFAAQAGLAELPSSHAS